MEWEYKSPVNRRKPQARSNCLGRAVGFTLPELLVAIGMMVVMTGVLLVHVQRGRRSDALRNAAYRLAANFERQRVAATSGAALADDVDAYGVMLDLRHDDRYVLFADRVACVQDRWGGTTCAGNGQYDPGNLTEPDEAIPGGVIVLPSGIHIADLSSNIRADVRFVIPGARMAIVPDQPTLTVTLQHEGRAETRRVTITTIADRVSVESAAVSSP